MKTELKPCPFCGKEAIIDGYDLFGYFVRCTYCSIVQDKLFGQKCDAIRRWNTRKGEKTMSVVKSDIVTFTNVMQVELPDDCIKKLADALKQKTGK